MSVVSLTGVLVGYARDRYWVTFDSSAGVQLEPGAKVPLLGSLAGLCVRIGRTLYSADSELDPRVDISFARKLRVRSAVCIPLKRGGETVGVLCLVSAKPSAFDESFVNSLKNLPG